MRTLRDERGAIAVLIAFSMVALLGFGAIVIDVGALYQERRTLQNSADASALAIAQDCAASGCGDYEATAAALTDANADDDDSDVFEVCGTGPGLPVCVDPPAAPEGAKYVRVTTTTRDAASGGTEVPFGLARVFGKTGKSVAAHSVVAYGPPAGMTTLPLAFSLCEFNELTNNGTTFAEPTGGDPPYSGTPQVIKFHDGNNSSSPEDCAAQAGQDQDGDSRLPGGFGWMQEDGGPCQVETDSEGWADSHPGATGNQTACDPATLLGSVIQLVVFDDIGTQPKQYHVHGYASFYVTGFRLGSPGQGWDQNAPCSSPTFCIGGYFVRASTTSGTEFGTVDLGTRIIKVIE